MLLLRPLVFAATAALIAATYTPSAAPVRAASLPSFDHVFVIVMENHAYSEIIGSPAAPYINGLAASGGVGTNYTAVAHPSLPNYLALAGGSTYGITTDCTTCWVSAPNVADNLEAAGKSWKAYQESMPSGCFVGDSGSYVQKHDPFIYFNNIRTNTSRCQSHVVPYSQLATDLRSTTTTPNYAFITPNSCNDMHDCSIQTGDAWLSQQVPQILSSPAFTSQRSLLALLWDEDDFTTANRVPLILVGSGITPGYQSGASYNHYSLVHTIEAALGLTTLTANDAGATIMSDFVNASATCAVSASLPSSVSTTEFAVTLAAPACGGAYFDLQQSDTTLNQSWADVGQVSMNAGSGNGTADGYQGHVYSLRARARSSAGAASPWSAAVSTQVMSNASKSWPFSGLYALDGWGGVHSASSGPLGASASWPGWKIARAAKAIPGANAPQSGFVLDGFGGLHPYGAPGLTETSGGSGHYWQGMDIARDFAFLPDGSGGFVLDGYGGLHGFRVNGSAAGLVAQGNAYWAGWDIARKVVVFPDGTGGYVLDGFGGLHPFGINGPIPSNLGGIAATSYWPGWSIARDLVLTPGNRSGYVLDGFGGLHPFHPSPDGSAMPGTISSSYFGWDITRGAFLLPGSATAGYTLDGYGGMHPFGGAPAITNHPYWPGWDIATSVWGA